jgi:hypothetical protein
MCRILAQIEILHISRNISPKYFPKCQFSYSLSFARNMDIYVYVLTCVFFWCELGCWRLETVFVNLVVTIRIFMFIILHVCVYIYTHTHTHIYSCITLIYTFSIYIYIHMYVHVYVYVYVYIYIYIYVYMYTYMYVYIYIHTHIYIHTYIYIYTNRQQTYRKWGGGMGARVTRDARPTHRRKSSLPPIFNFCFRVLILL